MVLDLCPSSARAEASRLFGNGTAVELVAGQGQCYALASNLDAPTPPWDRTRYDVLIAIPAAYDDAGLDAFYLKLPYLFGGGTHPRVQGAVIDINDARWQLVSWHYPEGQPWTRGRDSLETHILHCKGFFFQRGALNAY